jgi:hypothetical protein
MSNLSLEELEEAQNLLLDAYNYMGKVPSNSFSNNTQKELFLASFNDIGSFLTKMGVSLVY